MSQTSIDTIPEDIVAFDETITIEVNRDFNFSVSSSYLTVPGGGVGTIALQISTPEMDAGTSVAFDNPAVSFIGDLPNASVVRVDDRHTQINWINDEAHGGRSFFYRIHMVGVKPAANGNVQKFSLAHDPTIHNDPPS